MREYGQIQSAFWTDPQIRTLSDAAARLAAYLLTGPHTNGLGCFYLPLAYAQNDHGWDAKTTEDAFAALHRIGFAVHCPETAFVFIPKYLRWNVITNPNVAKARVAEWVQVPKEAVFYADVATALLTFGAFLDDKQRNRLETVSKGFPKAEETVFSPSNEAFETRPDPTRSDSDPDPNIDPPSGGSGERAPARPPPCPTTKIIELYHEILPMCPQVVKVTPGRQKAMTNLWRGDLNCLEEWQGYFEECRSSPFLTGRVNGSQDRPPFVANLDFLLKPATVVKVAEGYYHRSNGKPGGH